MIFLKCPYFFLIAKFEKCHFLMDIPNLVPHIRVYQNLCHSRSQALPPYSPSKTNSLRHNIKTKLKIRQRKPQSPLDLRMAAAHYSYQTSGLTQRAIAIGPSCLKKDLLRNSVSVHRDHFF